MTVSRNSTIEVKLGEAKTFSGELAVEPDTQANIDGKKSDFQNSFDNFTIAAYKITRLSVFDRTKGTIGQHRKVRKTYLI